ncbi:MAG: PQQ-binding-like beta-propeller repeat protein [Vicinamibacterales bacterium]
MRRLVRILLAVPLIGLVAEPAPAQWTQFRGPQAGVVADDPALPETWSETENVAWKTPIPGLGWSSPIVWNDHVFVTSAISMGEEAKALPGLYDPGDEQGKTKSTSIQRWTVFDIDARTGDIRWSTEVKSAVPPLLRHIKNSFASETPTTDGERVYVFFGSIGIVAALDFAGKILWSHDFGAFNGPQEFAPAASPVLHDGRLYVVNDNTTKSYLAAFEAKTGRLLWRVDREENENWSTPFIWKNERRTEIITSGRGRVRSYDLDGKPLWELSGMTGNVVPTPFSRHGLVYISSGYPGAQVRPVYAIKPGAYGDISLKPGESTNEYVVWFQPRLGTYQTSALVYGDYFYTLLDRGLLLCHDARTGQEIYGRKRIAAEATGFTASPWAYNGKIFLLGEEGDTFVIKAGPTFELVGKNSLNEMTLASPAIAANSLYIRTQSNLYKIVKKAQP